MSKAPPTQKEVPQTTKAQPTQQGFDKLLAWLDSDREKAGEKYNKIQARLIGVFSCFGCDAENLADETINVVISKIDWLIENYVGEPALYFYGVAKKIYLERRGKKPPPNMPPPHTCSEEEEQMHDCLDKSLDELSPDDKKVVLQYHEGEKQEKIKNRTKLAQDLGISRNALRIRVYRLHAGLRQRVQQRLNQPRPH
jgi:DNA-directed RNA polymerase specialized sigma24 family protein